MNTPFQFKQFTVNQDYTAMKVGTDGVLLGAWVGLEKHLLSILDVGTGTGLIALMMAQRSDVEVIDAVELNSEAYVQAVENFEHSNWSDRLFCYHASIQQFADEIEDKYDLIISNPPFYNSTYKELPEDRAMARHTESLSYKELLSSVSKLLDINGSCAFIIPFQNEEEFIATAQKYKLYPSRITRVRGKDSSSVKRSLMQFTFENKNTEWSELMIEITRHVYTEAYKKLVKEFYLKM